MRFIINRVSREAVALSKSVASELREMILGDLWSYPLNGCWYPEAIVLKHSVNYTTEYKYN